MTSPHDAPSAVELLESVREWLEHDVMSTVEGRLLFHARVAMNVLDIVRREIEMGPEQVATHRDVLDRLGHEDDASLARAVRAGEYDADLVGILRALRPVVEDKVKVANPRYLR